MDNQEGPSQNPEQSPYTNLQTLYVEDHPNLRLLGGMFLKKLGIKHDSAENGVQALEMFRKAHESGEAPAVIFTDYDMPAMSGIELAGEVKKISPETLVILGTGRKFEDVEIEELKKQGIDYYLYKPFGIDEIREAYDKIRLQKDAV